MAASPLARYDPWAAIVGGSEGVGDPFGRVLAAAGINFVLVARDAAKLAATGARLSAHPHIAVRTIACDMSNAAGAERVIAETADIEIGLLICNAGADYDFVDFLDASADRARQLVWLNALGPTLLCHHFGRQMRERGRGGLMLVGSLSGNAAHWGAAVYSGGKAYLQRFAEALWYELAPAGVHVLCFVLSLTRTSAMLREGLHTDHPDFPAAEPADVAAEGLNHLPYGPVHYANDRGAFAQVLNTLPRGESVVSMSRGVKALFRDRAEQRTDPAPADGEP